MKLLVYLTPNASHTKIEGWTEDEKGQKRLRVKVTSVPENGKANQALIKLLSQQLHIPQSRISLRRGPTSRLKHLEIEGTDGELIKIKERLDLL